MWLLFFFFLFDDHVRYEAKAAGVLGYATCYIESEDEPEPKPLPDPHNPKIILYADAYKKAKEEHKPLIVLFVSDSCPSCPEAKRNLAELELDCYAAIINWDSGEYRELFKLATEPGDSSATVPCWVMWNDVTKPWTKHKWGSKFDHTD